MSAVTLTNLLEQIATLPVADQRQLVTQLQENLNGTSTEPANNGSTNGSHAKPKVVHLKSIPQPDPEPNFRWIREHGDEYVGQWVALDGDRLIAHGTDGIAVHAAARADGSYLPLVTFLPSPVDIHCSYIELVENENIS